MSGVWAVIPVKPLRGALRRLTPALDAPVRRALQVAMLTDVLEACAGARQLAGVMVVTSDPDATVLAEGIAGARVVPDHAPPRGMNAAVVRGLAAVAGQGAEGALVLTADLPLARPDDIAAILGHPLEGPSALLGALGRRHRNERDAAAPSGAPCARASARTPSPATAPRRFGVVSRSRPWSGRRLALDIDTPARPDHADGQWMRPARPSRSAPASRWACCWAPGARSEDLAAVGAARGRAGDDLGAMLATRARAEGVVPGDILIVAHKVVSKAEGADRRPRRSRPRVPRRALSPRRPARAPELCELILGESARIVRRRGGTADLRDPPRLRLRQRRHRLLERRPRGRWCCCRAIPTPRHVACRRGSRSEVGGQDRGGGDRHPRPALPARPGERGDRRGGVRSDPRSPRRARPQRPGPRWPPIRRSPTSWRPRPASTSARTRGHRR